MVSPLTNTQVNTRVPVFDKPSLRIRAQKSDGQGPTSASSFQNDYRSGKPNEAETENNASEQFSPCIRCDLSAESKVLLISFAGHSREMAGTTMFEFVKLTADIPVKKVYLRDPNELWFQNGVPGIGNSVAAVCDYLTELCVSQAIERVVVIGNSAGGYAAIMFGILIGADEVHAFCPQTRLLDGSDSGSPQRVERVNALQTPNVRYLDLRELALQKHQKQTSIFVHYDAKEQRDYRHALYVADITGFHLVRHTVGGHAVATVLKHTGGLKRLLQEALQDDTTISKARVFVNELIVYPKWIGKSLVRRVQTACVMQRLPQLPRFERAGSGRVAS